MFKDKKQFQVENSIDNANKKISPNEISNSKSQFFVPGNMPLAFPPSYSHHLATLSADQRNYLLQQQHQLVLNLTANEQYNQHEP